MRRLTLVGSVLVVVVALSACSGGGSSSSSPAAPSSDASAATVPAPTADGARAATLIAESVDRAAEQENARMSGQVTIEANGETKTLPLDGALDFRSGAFEFGFDLSRLGVPGSDATVRTRMVDGVMFVSFGDIAGEAGRALSSILDGKEWLKLDLASLGMGADNPTGGGLAQADPDGVLDLLREIGEVETVGSETLRGVPTTHYRGTIDSVDAPVDVWVDGDGRSRKISAAVERAGIKAATQIEYYDFGADLDITEPRPEEVLDFSEFFGDWRPPADSRRATV